MNIRTDVRRRTSCRLCDGRRLELVVPLIPIPMAGAYVWKERLGEVQDTYALDLYFCQDCGHVQLLDVIDPELLFREFTYRTSASPGLVRHFSKYADSVLQRLRPEEESLVVDIGSNDGILLKFFQQQGLRVLGVDPAREIAKRATEAGIETLPEFLTLSVAHRIRKRYGQAAIVTANNAFAHADDMAEMLEGIRELLAPDGIFVFEASYLVDVVDKMLLGTIFHEHICYHAILPLTTFFARHGMILVDVEQVSIQGGSIIGFVRKAAGSWQVSAEVDRLVTEERRRGFDRPEVYRDFAMRINALRDEVRGLLAELCSKGARVAGFGAARGGTTLIYHFGLGDFLEYIVDDDPEKHYLYSPGLHIPVLPSEIIYERKPDYLFLLAWVHARPILERHRRFLDQGGHFVISHPKLEII